MPLLKIKNLHKTYTKKGKVITKALRGIDLDIIKTENLYSFDGKPTFSHQN